MYVFQSPLIPLLGGFITPSILSSALKNPFCGGFAYVAIMFAITFGLAVFSWYSLEKWFLQLRDLRPDNASFH
jgi:peptidoglycan/LPS O-acetylase OafA/YrhL